MNGIQGQEYFDELMNQYRGKQMKENYADIAHRLYGPIGVRLVEHSPREMCLNVIDKTENDIWLGMGFWIRHDNENRIQYIGQEDCVVCIRKLSDEELCDPFAEEDVIEAHEILESYLAEIVK